MPTSEQLPLRVGKARGSCLTSVLIFLVLVSGVGLSQVQAAIYTFNLSGNVNDGVVWDNTSPPYFYHQWDIYNLAGMGNYAPHVGDVLDVAVTLDHSYTVAASIPGTILSVGFYFYGYPNPDYNVGTTTTATFFNQGVQGLTTTVPTASGTARGVSGSMTIYYNTPVTFDKVVFHSTVTGVDGALNLNQASFGVHQIIPVPEPSSIALVGMSMGIFIFLRRSQN